MAELPARRRFPGARGLLLILLLAGCQNPAAGPLGPGLPVDWSTVVPSGQWTLSTVEAMPDLPTGLAMPDWAAKTKDYLDFVLNFDSSGVDLPLGWWDEGHRNLPGTTFGLQTYVGHKAQRASPSGSQEAVTSLPLVLSGSLIGLPMRNYQSVNYIQMAQTFFQKDNGINLVLNNTATTGGADFWYDLYPGILWTGITALNEPEGTAVDLLQRQADRWAANARILNRLGYDFAAFDHRTGQPVTRSFREPDAAAGVATILYWAYQRFGTADYLTQARAAMDWYAGLNFNPAYEILYGWGAYTALRMNAEQGTSYDPGKVMNWCLDPSARRDWRAQTGTWSGWPVDGLIGDNSPYVFSMNGWAMASAWAPIPRYDQRFARAVAKWMTNMANSSRVFFSDSLDSAHQSSGAWTAWRPYAAANPIPYEALKATDQGRSPYLRGDALSGGWADTDLSLYSGSALGLLGGVLSKTNDPTIFRIDCLKTDFYHGPAYPTWLFYNPNTGPRAVAVAPTGDGPVDLFDTVTGTFLARRVVGTVTLSLAGDRAWVLVEVPSGATLATDGQKITANGRPIRWHNQP